MKCSKCQQVETKVIESRDVSDGEAIRRRRACLKCSYRFTTYERVERPQLIVVKTMAYVRFLTEINFWRGFTGHVKRLP